MMRQAVRAFAVVFSWQLSRISRWLPVLVVFQLIVGVGVALGLGNLIPTTDQAATSLLVSGSPVNVVLATGLVMVPSLVSRAKESGSLTFLLLQPIPRIFVIGADFIVWAGVSTVGASVTLTVASIRYGIDVDPIWTVVPVGLAGALMATALGYCLALLSPSLVVTNSLSNLLLIAVLLYTPISFPADRLPAYVDFAHQFLPFASFAELFRWSLGLTYAGSLGWHVVVLLLWLVALVTTSAVLLLRSTKK